MERIYMDYASTTPVDERVFQVMQPWLTEFYGNPSSVYEEGRKSKQGIEAARLSLAKALNADAREIYFTSCGSESDNWAIKGAAVKNKDRGRHIITTQIEHHAVLHTCQFLEQEGFEVTYLPVDAKGFVDLDALEAAIRKDTILVSVMMANNEIGTIEPIEAIADIVKPKGILLHTDAVQAFGSIPVDVQALNVDMLSISGHKLYGPKGIGALYIRKGVPVDNLIHGGNQENKHRAGTENIAQIIGFGKAAELACENMAEKAEHLSKLRDYLIERVCNEIPQVRLNGDREKRLPGNAHFCFDFLNTQALLTSLDLAGIAASGGSACTAGSLEPSHVLSAIGLSDAIARSALRLTVGKYTTMEDIDRVVDCLKEITNRLRRL